ncbi:hypothetical protein ACQ4WP_04925 [Janthinobacterium sp. GB4P2]|uniref:hypothetical protein n=1 Tax=Janthinobacterium sp. GB4P2 TaxID=3424189 RepID=UPI003F26F2CB
MSSYFDPNALAQANGYSHGRIHGERDGYRNGHRQGYDEGYEAGQRDGHALGADAGWNDAVQVANVEMGKQVAYTNRHIADKKVLTQQLSEQVALIESLKALLDEVESENDRLNTSAFDMWNAANALQVSNTELLDTIASLHAEVAEKKNLYHNQLWHHNRIVILMNSMRAVLEDLIARDGVEAHHVRELFVQSYAEYLSTGLRKGTISVPLDQDQAFASTLPQSHKFLLRMLNG